MRRHAPSSLLRFLLPLVCGLAGPVGYGQAVYESSGSGLWVETVSHDTTGNNLTLTGSALAYFQGSIYGSGSVTKTGPGIWYLTGINSYTGGTIVTQGTLGITSPVATGPLTITGGTASLLDPTLTVTELSGTGGELVGPGEIMGYIPPPPVFTTTQSTSTTFSGVVARLKLVLSGSGTLTLAGSADNVSAAATVNNGTLVLAKDSTSTVHAIGSGLTVNSGGTAKLGGTGGDQIYFGATVVVNSGGTFDLAGRSEGVGSLTGGGTLTNSAASTTSTLTVGEDNSTFTLGGLLQNGAGTLALTKAGSGTVTLPGANTFSGDTTLSGGTLVLGHSLALQNSTLAYSSGTLSFGTLTAATFGGLSGNKDLPLVNTVAEPVALTVDGNASSPYSGVLSGGGSLAKTGSGTLTLSGVNTFTGGMTLSGGTLVLGHSLALQNITLAQSGGTLSFGALTAATLGGLSSSQNLALANATAAPVALTVGSNNASFTYSGVFSGGGSLTKSGSGTLTLSGANTYTGGTTVNAGELTLTSTASLAAAGALAINGGTFRFHNANLTVVSLSGTGGTLVAGTGIGALTVNQASATTFSGSVVSTHLAMGGSGTLTLAGASDNAFAAATVNNGTLVLAKSSTSSVHAIGTGLTVNSGGTAKLGGTGGDQIYFGATVVVNSGGTLDLAGKSEGIGSLTGAGTLTNSAASTASTLTVGQDNSTFTFGGSLQNGAGTLALAKVGSGTLTLPNGNTYSGGTSLSAGTLTLGSDTALGTGALALNGGTLQASGSRTLANAIGLNADSTLGGSSPLTLAGGVTLNGFKTLTITNTATTTLSGGIGESSLSALIKLGNGELQLTGASTYTGGTLIGAGTVRINNTSGSAFGTGAVTVASGATLTGAGSFSGAFQNNGSFLPGNSPTLSTLSSFSQGSTGTLVMELGGLGRGTGYDALNITGAAVFGGTLTVTLIDSFNPTSGASFNLFDWGSASGTFATLNLPTLGNGLSWNTSALYTSGELSVSAIPEPSTYAALAGLAMLGFAFYYRRRQR